MFGFLRRTTYPAGAAEPSTAPITAAATSVVTTDVTAPELTTGNATVVTTDVTAEVTETAEPKIEASRIINKWADRKPFPYHFGGSDTVLQVWPVNAMPAPRSPTAEQIAQELFSAMQRQPMLVGRWVPALNIQETIYPIVCEQLGWPMRPWLGKAGVARFLADLSSPGQRPRYKRVEIDGKVHNLQCYYVPERSVCRGIRDRVTPPAG